MKKLVNIKVRKLAINNDTAGNVTLTVNPMGLAWIYRTRRVFRNEGAGAEIISYSGGTSVSEWGGTSSTPLVEYIRGSDYGGGIGGILYTLRNNVPGYTHYDARGDVTQKVNAAGQVTYQVQYEAFGTRTKETGSTLDRQKANTKEEDPTGLLNEGFRYRDLKYGLFITKDPLGFIDGPNLYTYVQQNPWTKFDPEGLESLSQDAPSDETIRKRVDSIQEERSKISDKLKSGSYYSQRKELARTARSLVEEQKFLTKVLEVRSKIGPKGYGEWGSVRELDYAFGGVLGIGSEMAKARPYFKPASGYLATDKDAAKVAAASTVLQVSVIASGVVPLAVEGAGASWAATTATRQTAMQLATQGVEKGTVLYYTSAEKIAEATVATTLVANQKIVENAYRIANKALDPTMLAKVTALGEAFAGFIDKNNPTGNASPASQWGSLAGRVWDKAIEWPKEKRE